MDEDALPPPLYVEFPFAEKCSEDDFERAISAMVHTCKQYIEYDVNNIFVVCGTGEAAENSGCEKYILLYIPIKKYASMLDKFYHHKSWQKTINELEDTFKQAQENNDIHDNFAIIYAESCFQGYQFIYTTNL